MWSYTFIIRLNYSLLSLPMLALRKLSPYPKKNWKIYFHIFSCVCLAFQMKKAWSLTCGWSELLICTWENITTSFSFSLFLLQAWMILWHVFPELCLFLVSGDMCKSAWKHGALRCCCCDKIANKTKFAKTVSYRWTVIFLKKLVVFSQDPWNWGGIFY